MSWDTRLAEPVPVLGGEQTLVTLRDAALFLTHRFSTLKSGMLTGAIEDLMSASDDPSPDQVRQATFQLLRLLQEENMLRSFPAGLSALAQETLDQGTSRMATLRESKRRGR